MSSTSALSAPMLKDKVNKAIHVISINHKATPCGIARNIGLSRETLCRHMNRGKTRTEAREVQQKLTQLGEKVLTNWITDLTATGHPTTPRFICELPEEIRQQRGTKENYLPLGKNWVSRFIRRHSYLKAVISHSIETAHIKEVTPEVVSDVFNALKACIEKYKIASENMYNMYETGTLFYNTKVIVLFAIETAQTSYVVVDARLHKKYQA